MIIELLRAYDERKKEKGRGYDIYKDDSPFGTVFLDVSNALDNLPATVSYLCPQNWRDSNILEEPPHTYPESGRIRKPEAFFKLRIDRKYSLCLEWLPSNPNDLKNIYRTDWHNWGTSGYRKQPSIIRLRSFEFFLSNYHKKAYSPAESYLVQSVRSLLRFIYKLLSDFIDIKKINDLFLEPDAIYKLPLTGCLIRNIEDVEKEKWNQMEALWLKETFDEILKITPMELLQTLAEAGMSYSKAAKALESKIQASTKLTSDKLKRIVIRLYKEHSELYSRTLKEPPKGIPKEQETSEKSLLYFKPKNNK